MVVFSLCLKLGIIGEDLHMLTEFRETVGFCDVFRKFMMQIL